MKEKLLQQTIESQNIASNPKNSAWVFASAGSGKTKILIDRLLRLLLAGVDGNKILCVTFTKVAAIEMQDRINEVLESWMTMDEEKLKSIISDLTEQSPTNIVLKHAKSLFLKLMDSENAIKIVTIHSLCQDILKIFPFETGVSPNFKVMDQSKEKLILNQAKKAVFGLCASDKELETIVTRINSEISQEEYLKLLGRFLSNKEKILLLKRKFFNIDNITDQLYKILAIKKEEKDDNHLSELKKEIDFTKLNELLQEIKSSEKTAKIDEDFLSFFEDFDKKNQDEVIQNAQNIFFRKDGGRRAKVISKKFENYSDFIADLQEKFEDFFDLVNSYITASYTELILRFVDKILQKYQELKEQNHLLDYNDLIVKTNELLNNDQYKEWVKYRLDGFYDHVLIDESQDTNINQWNIIKAICEDFFTGDSGKDCDRTIFVIGDNKQSIFGFQGADPQISDNQYEYYKNLSLNSKNSVKKLSLHNSFRSLPQVLEFVDEVFTDHADFAVNNYQKHNAIRQEDGLVEVWPIFNNEDKIEEKYVDFTDVFTKDVESNQKDRNKVDLAKHITTNILDWVNSKRQITKRSDKENKSAIEFGDIMIVLRNQTNGFSDILKEHFIEAKIPFRGAGRLKFSENLLLMDLLSLAKFALLPIDDLNLASLFKSGFFRMSEEDLLEICNLKNAKNISIFQAIEICAKKFSDQENQEWFFDENEEEKVEKDREDGQNKILTDVNHQYFHEIYQKLVKIIDLSKNLDIFEFYLSFIDEKFTKEAKNEFGSSSKDIIEEFFLLINNILLENEGNLQYFVDIIEKTDPEIKLELSNENSVVITTIHSSKGLQSPIVIVPDCCFNFNKMLSVKDDIIWTKRQDENYGEFELPIWLARKKYSSKILDKELSYRKIKLKEEYLRLFYVALTRSENELYIAGFGSDNDEDSWYNLAK